MKIIIAGNGKVGLSLAKRLSTENHDITLIDTKQSVLDITMERFDVMAIQGNCAAMPVLKQAGVKKADLLIAVTGKDEINLLCCLTAHAMNPDLHTIARIRNPEYSSQVFEMRDTFALSLSVNPEKQAAKEIERLLKYPGFLKRDTFAKGRVEIVELRIDANSKLQNVALTALNNIVNCNVLVCVVRRNGKAIIPTGNFILREGDRIYVTAPTNNLTTLLKNLGIITHKAKNIILCGGGRVSYYLAQQFAKGDINIQLIEKDYDRCVKLAADLPNINVIHGDASNQFLLESEGVNDCDALVAMTGLDEMNMIISLYGQNLKIPQIITKVDHTDNSSILDTLSLGSVVCPRELCCTSIVRYIHAMQNITGAALTVHGIADGEAEALEFRANADTLHLNTPLKNIRLKPNILIVCITHDNQTVIPNGNSSFGLGDTVIVVTNTNVTLLQLNDIFE